MNRPCKYLDKDGMNGTVPAGPVPSGPIPTGTLPAGRAPLGAHEPDLFEPSHELASPPQIADEDMVQEYLQTRSRSVFEQLVRRYERELYTYLRRFIGDAQAAEDVFQATFLSVHLRIEQFEPGRRFRPWLYAIASNKAIDYMRRNKRHQIGSLNAPAPSSDRDETLMHKLASPAALPETEAISRETEARVREALQQLSEPTQQLIQLAFYQGMKYSDISETLQIPVGTVKSRVFTAIRKLNAIWMRMNQEDSPNESNPPTP